MLIKIFLKILSLLNPEFSHKLVIYYLKYGFIAKKNKISSDKVSIKLFNHLLSNPIGLAAGFDKNAEGLKGLLKLNFSFIEIGTVTPLPQKGNIKPRVFRFKKKESIINSLGFPNSGVEKVYENLKKIRKKHPINQEPLIGANIGYNKNSKNPFSDYLICLEKLFLLVDYISINISSPNTPGLRKFQSKKELSYLLKKITQKRKLLEKKYCKKMPLAIKISPDNNKSNLEEIVNTCIKYNIQSIIATNTSTQYSLIKKNTSNLKGGISGKSLFLHSNKTLSFLNNISKKKIQIIGVGGIHDTRSLIKKIELGADAVQLYSSLVFKGPNLIEKLIYNLHLHLKNLNLSNLNQLKSKINAEKKK